MSSRPGFEARTMFVLFQIVSTFFCIVLLLNTVFLPFVCNNIFIYDMATWKRKFLINETWEMKQKYILYCNLYRTSVRYQMIWSYHICIYMIHPYEIYDIWYVNTRLHIIDGLYRLTQAVALFLLRGILSLYIYFLAQNCMLFNNI